MGSAAGYCSSPLLLGHGSGSNLPLPVLALAGISTIVAVVVSGISIWLQLRNYRKPLLQRMVVRIMVMVPLYAVSSLISLFSLEAAFFIDAIRDIYEAFVIYCFFVLLLDYLGGERSLLILLHGRPPIPAVFPVNLWRGEIDSSDPYTFLFLKRGILQYVQVKPLLALASLIMKATGTYNEGDFRARSGYLYVSIVYNISICLALWCLAVFWMCVHQDLKPFRPVPKFLCVKGILFFSFWQSIAVSFLVAVGHTLICIEMPFFAAAHMYAFSYRDFTKPPASAAGKSRSPIYVARITLAYALRDALGLKDLVEDTRATLRGEGINYRAFEPSEGGMHIAADAEDVVHDAPDMQYRRGVARIPGDDVDVEDEDEYALTFSDALAGADEVLYEHAKKYVFGDYLYPVVDVSSEEARRAMWEEEERVVREIASGGFGGNEAAFPGYGATQSGERRARKYDDDVQDDAHHASTGTSKSDLAYISPTSLASVLLLLHSTSSSSSSPRLSKRTSHTPLVEEDAVDLVVSAPDSLQVPSIRTSRGPHSPHSPALIRVWDELGPGSGSSSPVRTVVDEDEGNRRGDASDLRFVITVDDVGTDAGGDMAMRCRRTL
ncbi:DUF300 domain-containing protein [Lanmaoa asiatica]|nr:DUF300 domain-containing protein [Lanmaoa asiatica]